MYRNGHLLVLGLIMVETIVWVYLLYKLFVVYRQVKSLVKKGSPLGQAIKKSVSHTFYSNRIFHFIKTEISIWYYAFFAWRTRSKPQEGETAFTFHKNSVYFGLYIVFVHEQFFEGFALHFWLHSFSSVFAWLSTSLHLYSMIWLVGDYNALRFSRVIIAKDHLHIKVGLRKTVVIPLDSIETFSHVNMTQRVKKSQEVFTAAILPAQKFIEALGELPQFELVLTNPACSTTFLGRIRPVSTVFIRLDNPSAFSAALQNRLHRIE